MPELPSQSVTEEKYKDENGHIVVKTVKLILLQLCCIFYMEGLGLDFSCSSNFCVLDL